MERRRWWPWVRTLAVAHLFGIAAVGLAEWVIVPVRDFGMCIPPTPPYKRAQSWIESATGEPLAAYFSKDERTRLGFHLAGVVLAGAALGWSVWSLGPTLRPRLRLRLGTMMLLVAVVAAEGASLPRTWAAWGRWNHARIAVPHYEAQEESRRGRHEEDFPGGKARFAGDEELLAESLRDIAESAYWKNYYRGILWQPWSDPEPDPEFLSR